jgi:hypothetical protein
MVKFLLIEQSIIKQYVTFQIHFGKVLQVEFGKQSRNKDKITITFVVFFVLCRQC